MHLAAAAACQKHDNRARAVQRPASCNVKEHTSQECVSVETRRDQTKREEEAGSWPAAHDSSDRDLLELMLPIPRERDYLELDGLYGRAEAGARTDVSRPGGLAI